MNCGPTRRCGRSSWRDPRDLDARIFCRLRYKWPQTSRTFAAIPPETADVLRPSCPTSPTRRSPRSPSRCPTTRARWRASSAAAVRRGVEIAFQRFLGLVLDPAADVRSARAAYVNLGRGEYHAGRSLDALLAAYRVGARLAWRRFVEAGREGGLAPEVLYDLGEAIFAYIDEISAESADGYAQEQSAAAGEAQRRRRRLVRVLGEDPPASEEAIRTVAAAAGWELPRARGGARGRAGGRRRAGEDDARRRRRRRSPGGSARDAAPSAAGASTGTGACACSCPTRARPGAGARSRPRSRAPAPRSGRPCRGRAPRRACAAPPPRSRSPSDGLVVADEHLATLLLAADPALGAELAAARLAPLDGLADGQRERLEADAARLAGPPRPGPGGGRGARRAPADRALPDDAGCASCSASASRIPRPASSSASRSAWRPCASNEGHAAARHRRGGDARAGPPRRRAGRRPRAGRPRPPRDRHHRRGRHGGGRARRRRRTPSSTAPPGPTSTARRSSEELAARVNAEGAGNVAAAAAAAGALAIQISTDYSFDGTASEPYTESSPTKRDRRLRPHQARGRARRRRGRDAGLRDRAQLLAVRPARQELRRHDPARSAPSATSCRSSTTRSAARPTPATSRARSWRSPSGA